MMEPEERYPDKSKSSRAPRLLLLFVVLVAAFAALVVYDRRTTIWPAPNPLSAGDQVLPAPG